ncbi:MAG: glycoside hydrolase family 88 protein, partial [Bacteroidetes bacterium]
MKSSLTYITDVTHGPNLTCMNFGFTTLTHPPSPFSCKRRGIEGVELQRTSSKFKVKSVLHNISYIIVIVVLLSACSSGEKTMQGSGNQSWSRQIADSFIARHPGAVTYDSGSSSQKWNYEQGLMLVALYKLWQHTNDKRYFEFMQDNLDLYVENDGNIKTYKLEDYNKDNIGPGRALLAAYQEKKKEKYKVAADLLMLQLRRQPRTNEGGFWHKKIYPYQMWLDGLFMAEPFHAWYAQMFNEPKAFDDIVNQFIWISSHTRDAKTGLYYHAWDESKQQRWANPETGCSPHFWGRAIGWYGMGLIDVLDYMPERHPKRKQLETLLKELAESLLKFRDGKSHLWYLLLDQGDKEGNYFESSASS